MNQKKQVWESPLNYPSSTKLKPYYVGCRVEFSNSFSTDWTTHIWTVASIDSDRVELFYNANNDLFFGAMSMETFWTAWIGQSLTIDP